MKIDLSVIIPLYNETESLDELSSWIQKVIQELNLNYEIIFIDDGSTDNSWSIINSLQKNNNNIKDFHLEEIMEISCIKCGV